MNQQNLPHENERLADTAPLGTSAQGSLGSTILTTSFGAKTHRGKVRSNNEDQFLIARLTKSVDVLHSSLPNLNTDQFDDQDGYLFMVADGMGGHAGGERASAIVVEEVQSYILHTAKWFFRLDDPDETVRMKLLREAIEKLDRKLVTRAEADPSLRGMGTTLTAGLSFNDSLYIVHVGDSRAYLHREGELTQITRDHTLAQKLVDAGILEPEEARTNRGRHVLTNTMGSKPGVDADILKLRLASGDRLLLCSDGLTEELSDERLGELLAQHREPERTCEAMLDEALQGKARDNITLVLADFSQPE